MRISAEIEQCVLEVLKTGKLAQGDTVKKLEFAFSQTSKTKHSVAVNNGTTALVAALESVDIGENDEVIIPAFTFVATLNAVLLRGARARIVDVRDDYLLDVEQLSVLDTSSTACVMPVHLYGQMCDMKRINEISENSSGFTTVEDAAQALGSERDDLRPGAHGLACYSLYATKNVFSGEGGMICTNNHEAADYLRILRNQGMRARYDYQHIGNNYRMSEIHAAVALPQMALLETITNQRAEIARRYTENLRGLAGLLIPTVHEETRHSWHQYTIRITSDAPFERDEFVQQMRESGIDVGVYYPRSVHDYDIFREHPQIVVESDDLARKIASEVVSLPVHQHLTAANVERVIETVHELWHR